MPGVRMYVCMSACVLYNMLCQCLVQLLWLHTLSGRASKTTWTFELNTRVQSSSLWCELSPTVPLLWPESGSCSDPFVVASSAPSLQSWDSSVTSSAGPIFTPTSWAMLCALLLALAMADRKASCLSVCVCVCVCVWKEVKQFKIKMMSRCCSCIISKLCVE